LYKKKGRGKYIEPIRGMDLATTGEGEKNSVITRRDTRSFIHFPHTLSRLIEGKRKEPPTAKKKEEKMR